MAMKKGKTGAPMEAIIVSSRQQAPAAEGRSVRSRDGMEVHLM